MPKLGQQLREGARIAVPVVDDNCPTRHLYCLDVDGTQLLHTHANCQHNQLRSAYQRVLMPVPLPQTTALLLIRQQLDKFAEQLEPTGPISYQGIINYFPIRKRRGYIRALDDLMKGPLKKSDMNIVGFVKAEKLMICDKDGDPRMIQYRSQRYNLAFGRYTRAIEKSLYGLTDKNGHRVIMKGCNSKQRAYHMRTAWDMYDDPVAVAFDLSRWDAHCSERLIFEAHRFYLKLIPSDEFAYLLKHQLYNKAYTTAGVRYATHGGVMSGDMTTALGNCVLLSAMVLALVNQLGLNLSFLDDGDDHCLIGEREDMQVYAQAAPRWFTMCGHELKIEGLTSSFHEILFCQHRPVYVVGGWDLMPNPMKVISTSCCIPEGKCLTIQHLWSYLAEVWYMRALLHAGQPVLGPLFYNNAKRINYLRSFTSAKDRATLSISLVMKIQRVSLYNDTEFNVPWIEVTPESRVHCSEAWGIEEHMQVQWEEMTLPLPLTLDMDVDRLFQQQQGQMVRLING